MQFKGKIFNERYKVVDFIAEGGMAVIYEGTDLLLVRKVAIKILKEQFVKDKIILERFYREARAAGALSHANIVSIYDIGKEGDIYFIIMEYVSGGSLDEYLRKKKVLSPQEVVKIGIQICRALDYAHERGIIHRDIKPQNILLTDDKKVKVGDFGIARAISSRTLTEVGEILGSVYYFSPEQAQGKPSDKETDIYSLGVVLYQLITGQVPFTGESIIEIALKHVKEIPKKPSRLNPDTPLELERIILKAMSKQPRARYHTAYEMLTDLKSCIKTFDEQLLKEETEEEEPKEAEETEEVVVIEETPPLTVAPLEEKDVTAREASAEEEVILPPSGVEEVELEPEEFEDEEIVTLEELRRRKKLAPHKKSFWGWASSLLLLLVLASGITFWQSYLHKKSENRGLYLQTTEVPYLLGRTLTQAEKILKDKGLVLKLVAWEENYEYNKGSIIRQNPGPGKLVEINKEVEVVASKGAPMVTVPYLIYKSFSEAQVILNNKGLHWIIAGQIEDDKVPSEYVISQEPPAGTEVKGKSCVRLIISKRRAQLGIPDLRGISVEKADEILKALGLILKIKSYQSDKIFRKGEIISQSPPAGSPFSFQQEVAVVVSSGPPLIITPDFTGKTLAEAKELAHKVEVELEVENSVDISFSEQRKVVSQNPLPGKPLPEGTRVSVYLEEKELLVAVPDVRGKLLFDARATLKLSRLNLKVVEERVEKSVPVGTVLFQNPLPGTKVKEGGVVELTIASAGVGTVVNVPELIGMNLEEAKLKLEECGLTLGVVLREPNSEEEPGVVLSQRPSAGREVKKGEKIDLVVSY